jgi:CheY-like chemotaxis protein
MDARELNYLVLGSTEAFRATTVGRLRARGCAFVDAGPLHATVVRKLSPGLADVDVLLFEITAPAPEQDELLHRVLSGPFAGDLVLALRPGAWLSGDTLRLLRRAVRRNHRTIGAPPTAGEIDGMLASGLLGVSGPAVDPAQAVSQVQDEGASDRTLLAAPDGALARRLHHDVQRLGRPCDHVGDEAAAFERWRRGGHALLITTCDLRDFDGFGLVRWIREAEAERGTSEHLPIVGIASRIDRRRAREAGFDNCLMLPWAAWELAATIETLLDWAERRAVGTGRRASAPADRTGRGPPAVE